MAFMFIMLGLYRFFAGANFGGLWLAFIGSYCLTHPVAATSR